MSITLYDITVPVMAKGLRAMAGFLEKGRAHAEAKGMDPQDLLQARLFEDMATLTSQVQRACDSAKFTTVRIGQQENQAFEDNEASFEELQARIAATLAFIEKAPAAAFEGRESAEVLLETPRGKFAFTGRSYAQDFALPNFYFHLTTAYALLRHKGVPLGKLDFLGVVMKPQG